MMNAPAKYVVSKTLEKPIWRNTTIIRDDVIESVRALKAQPGKNILTDGSSQLVHTLLAHDLVDELHLLVYPLALGSGKRLFPDGAARGVRAEVRDALSRPASSASTTCASASWLYSIDHRPCPIQAAIVRDLTRRSACRRRRDRTVPAPSLPSGEDRPSSARDDAPSG